MNSFELLRTHSIPTLQASLEEYRDPSTGAVHIHLANDGADLAFLVAFPTVPDSSDGRAHILEHLALCGSQRYPVRDPFFSMMRRSTAPFMNAMTYADRTVYPFVSTDARDYFNLLDVYLDAAFFPELDYLNFLQEGWRHVLDDGKLAYQGVVLNEMKGAFADPGRALYQGLMTNLLQGTTYAVVSGGDPLDIPDLTHAALKDFHARHYHPSQAVFMTAGAVPARQIQEHISERVLARLSGTAPMKMPQLATLAAPREAVIEVPALAASDNGFGIQFAWIVGESADGAACQRARLLEAGLLGDASAPLRKAMESAGYGRPSNMNGIDDSARQLVLHLGMEGLTRDQVADAQQRIMAALEQTAQAGVPQAVLHAALRNIRYQQRSTANGGMPNVLMRMLAVAPVAMRGGNVLDAFDSERVLGQLEQQIVQPGYFENMVRELLDSPARLTATIVPEPAYFAQREQAESARLARETAALTDADRSRIAADNAALLARQDQQPDMSVLPRITPQDVSRAPRPLPQLDPQASRHSVAIASNGISYAHVQYDVTSLNECDWPWLQLYVDLRASLGLGDRSYDEADAWRQQAAPAFHLQLSPALNDGVLRLALSFEASGLREEHQGIADVIRTYIENPRFDEFPRIAFLCTQMAQNRIHNLAQMGDRYAHFAAGASASRLRYFESAVDGIGYLPFICELQARAASAEGVAWIAAQLTRIHRLVIACPASVICAGSGDDAGALAQLVGEPGAHIKLEAVAPAKADDLYRVPMDCALHAPSQVNHCYTAWPAPDERHHDAPALAVAAELLTHQFLHTAIREKGGAYGGAASYSASAGIFAMTSYRDPRLAETYADFAQALDSLMETTFTDEQIEQAIISVIKGLDRPLSPFDAVRLALSLQQRGINAEQRVAFRTGVLACTASAIKAAVEQWLRRQTPARAAFVGDTQQDLAGLEVLELLALANPEQVVVEEPSL